MGGWVQNVSLGLMHISRPFWALSSLSLQSLWTNTHYHKANLNLLTESVILSFDRIFPDLCKRYYRIDSRVFQLGHFMSFTRVFWFSEFFHVLNKIFSLPPSAFTPLQHWFLFDLILIWFWSFQMLFKWWFYPCLLLPLLPPPHVAEQLVQEPHSPTWQATEFIWYYQF